MKKSFLLLFTFLLSIALSAQNKNNIIEAELFFRWDSYPVFTNEINSISSYKLKIQGRSWGVNTTYKIPLKKNYFIKAGAGYYKYSFTEIVSTNNSFGNGNSRVINYPTTLGINLVTDKYWYNVLSLNTGFDKSITLNKKNQILIGALIKNYITFSQYYHVPYDNSFIPQQELKIKNDYKTSNVRYFGIGASVNASLLRKFGRVNIGPTLSIPIYDNWRQDKIFPTEANKNNRNKWLKGIGVGIICNY